MYRPQGRGGSTRTSQMFRLLKKARSQPKLGDAKTATRGPISGAQLEDEFVRYQP